MSGPDSISSSFRIRLSDGVQPADAANGTGVDDKTVTSSSVTVTRNDILLQDNVDVVIAETADGLEPLHAVYRRGACLPAIEAAMDSGRLRMISWFPDVRVRRLKAEEIRRYDPDGLAFLNVNTPADFVRAERIAGR